ncbi:MAG: hypothetical protein WA324_00955 [Bryobacteraceae bacterium]
MPLIQPEAPVVTERRAFRLRHELLEKICAYAKMISSSEDYVVAAGLEAFFRGDKDFQKYLADNPDLLGSDGLVERKKRGRPQKLAVVKDKGTNISTDRSGSASTAKSPNISAA